MELNEAINSGIGGSGSPTTRAEAIEAAKKLLGKDYDGVMHIHTTGADGEEYQRYTLFSLREPDAAVGDSWEEALEKMTAVTK